mgnify:CR=1 FL=1
MKGNIQKAIITSIAALPGTEFTNHALSRALKGKVKIGTYSSTTSRLADVGLLKRAGDRRVRGHNRPFMGYLKTADWTKGAILTHANLALKGLAHSRYETPIPRKTKPRVGSATTSEFAVTFDDFKMLPQYKQDSQKLARVRARLATLVDAVENA